MATAKKVGVINPIAREVQETFNGIYAMTTSFIKNPESAINGMIVSGDAGTGKTYTIRKALIDAKHHSNVEYIKGGKITAATLYVKLYLNRAKHRIVVLDDCDIIHHQEYRGKLLVRTNLWKNMTCQLSLTFKATLSGLQTTIQML
jgi:hypothetical protein